MKTTFDDLIKKASPFPWTIKRPHAGLFLESAQPSGRLVGNLILVDEYPEREEDMRLIAHMTANVHELLAAAKEIVDVDTRALAELNREFGMNGLLPDVTLRLQAAVEKLENVETK